MKLGDLIEHLKGIRNEALNGDETEVYIWHGPQDKWETYIDIEVDNMGADLPSEKIIRFKDGMQSVLIF